MDTKEKKHNAGASKHRSVVKTTIRRKPSVGTTEKNASPVRTKATVTKKSSASQARKTVARPVRKRTQKSVAQPAQEVVYTQPGPFNRNRFLLRLVTVVAVVLALVFGISIFFKVDEVMVSGNEKYEVQAIAEASGIHTGDNLLGLNKAKIASSIIAELPYVDRVRVGIKLPDTVKIEVTELAVVYAIEADDGSWWLMRADGGIVEKTSSAEADLHTKVLGVQITGAAVGEQALPAQPITDETTAEGQPVPATVSAKEQLDTAITVLQCLEDQSILGDMASIDVGNLNDLKLWLGTRFQISLGDTTNLIYKIKSMNAAVNQMGDYESGILDVSYTTWPDKVGYTPFE